MRYRMTVFNNVSCVNDTVETETAEQMLLRMQTFVLLTFRKKSEYFGNSVYVYADGSLIITTGKGVA